MDLRTSLLIFNVAMIYIIHKNLALIKSDLNYVKDNIFKFFFKKYNTFIFLKNNFFS